MITQYIQYAARRTVYTAEQNINGIYFTFKLCCVAMHTACVYVFMPPQA